MNVPPKYRPFNRSEIEPQKPIYLFLLIFLVAGAIVSSLFFAFYRAEVNSFHSKVKVEEKVIIELQKDLISGAFDTIISDLFFLAEQNELIHFLDTGSENWLKAIETEYVTLSKRKKVYDQLRFLDDRGRERVRVNFNKNLPAAVDKKNLQNKSLRYYFSDTISLNNQEVFISPLDLNVEKDQIETPFKPMIRFATPVYDSANHKRGIVLINYLADSLLKEIQERGELKQGSAMLLNREGFWLLNSKKRQDEWGFMFEKKNTLSFPNRYPEEWSHMVRLTEGQIETRNGLFTFSKLKPLKDQYHTSTGSGTDFVGSSKSIEATNYFWFLLSHISTNDLNTQKTNILLNFFILGAGLFVAVALCSWLAALTITKRQVYQAELISMATHDALTGLPNRLAFFDNLQKTVAHSKRFKRKFALLYIDLDGFKEINDRQGHNAGDELLVKVGEIFTSSTRRSDTVARLGGDEFACILFEIGTVKAAELAGEKIIHALSNPIKIMGKHIKIGASVGVSVFPDIEGDSEALLKSADEAMYISKANGRNICTLAKKGAVLADT